MVIASTPCAPKTSSFWMIEERVDCPPPNPSATLRSFLRRSFLTETLTPAADRSQHTAGGWLEASGSRADAPESASGPEGRLGRSEPGSSLKILPSLDPA